MPVSSRLAAAALVATAYLAAALPPCGFDGTTRERLLAEQLAAERGREQGAQARADLPISGPKIARPCTCGCDHHAGDVTTARLGPFVPAGSPLPLLTLARPAPPPPAGVAPAVVLAPPDPVPIAS